FQVIHLSGRQDDLFLAASYKDSGIKARTFRFFDSMEYAYSVADIVISRAGALSISEILFFGLASILIPYPHARRHQIKNASYLLKNRAAILIEEEGLGPEILQRKLLELFENPVLRESLSQNASLLFLPQADMALADLVLNEAQTYGTK
ncbi:MAG: glycosyltransferase, partial [Candidatus Omnitrophota bacterium]